jgi:Fur family transcriptional regulator, peroxide stress response regulator
MPNFTTSERPIDIFVIWYIIIVIIIVLKNRRMGPADMYRKSKQKEAIMRVIKETRSHPDAEWIYDQVKHEIPSISLGTVYRNLKNLKEMGKIAEVCSSADMSHYDGDTSQHYHFRCDNCGDIFDLDEKIDRTIEERVARKTGFKVTHHTLELGGLCLKCRRFLECKIECTENKDKGESNT